MLFRSGKTPVEAMENTQVIISEWLEYAKERGQEIPEPRGKLELKLQSV